MVQLTENCPVSYKESKPKNIHLFKCYITAVIGNRDEN